MKRIAIAAAFALAALGSPARSDDINVYVNGRQATILGTQPQEINGFVMVPLRDVLQQTGGTVVWDATTKTAIANRGDTHIKVPIGSETAQVNGRDVTLDAPATVVAGSTMVPLKFISNALGAQVAWASDTRTVRIDTTVSTASYNGETVESYAVLTPTTEVAENSTVTTLPNEVAENNAVTTTETYADQGNTTLFHRTYGPLTMATGTIIDARLDKSLSSDRSVPGDMFTATVLSGPNDGGLPSGAKIEGTVAKRYQPGMAGPVCLTWMLSG